MHEFKTFTSKDALSDNVITWIFEEDSFRPDGAVVSFGYDALGRRIFKHYKQTTTNWHWDGNVPLHEWKGFVSKDALSENLITWIFEEDSFSPMAKLRGEKKYSILADHLGTPIEMYQDDGSLFWERQLNANGKTIKETQQGSCPFLFQGQYYDAEIELAYNRFRYYDVEDGRYISQDPIGLLSGEFGFYNYVLNPNLWVDIFGLKKSSYSILSGPLHHIATNKNTKRGKKWTNKFKPFFDKAGLDMDGADNKVYVPGHKGPHPDAYHKHVLKKLNTATKGIDPVLDQQKYQDAVKSALSDIAKDAQTSGSQVNKWLLKI